MRKNVLIWTFTGGLAILGQYGGKVYGARMVACSIAFWVGNTFHYHRKKVVRYRLKRLHYRNHTDHILSPYQTAFLCAVVIICFKH